MAQSPYRYAVVLGLALFGGGCTPHRAPEPNEFQIGLAQIKDEMTKDCEALGAPPGNQVGNLLQDYNDLTAIAAPCRERHNALVYYLRPLIEKAKRTQ